MIPLAIGVTSVCVGRWIYKKTSSCSCPNQELNVEENQTKQQAWNFKKGILSTAISKICLDIYDGNPVNITELIQPNRIEFCNRQLFIEEPNSLQHVASIYFIDSKKTIIISCIGSKTFKDWLSNFTHFNSTNNEKNVPDFIWDSALDIYNNFNQHCKQKNISDYTIICCGHSRGGGIASCLGYHIKSKHQDLDVKVVTYACPAYAKKDFKEEYCNLIGIDNIVNKLSIYDPIAALRIFFYVPGPVTFIELENYCENIILGPLSLAGISLINSFYTLVTNALELIGTASAAQLGYFITTRRSMSTVFIALNTLLWNFIDEVGEHLFNGRGHTMVYYDLNENGPFNMFVKHFLDLLDTINLTGASILTIIWKGLLLVFDLLKLIWTGSIELIGKLFKEVKNIFIVNKIKIN